MALESYRTTYVIFMSQFFFFFKKKDLHLQTTHYSTEETNHAKIFDNIDRLDC